MSDSNYVTCVQFNPVDESYFISQSIDGKVWIWSIGSSKVVDWTDIREIITAVTYNPDRKGGIIGSMTVCCRFFSLSGFFEELDALEADMGLEITGEGCLHISNLITIPKSSSFLQLQADMLVELTIREVFLKKPFKPPSTDGYSNQNEQLVRRLWARKRFVPWGLSRPALLPITNRVTAPVSMEEEVPEESTSLPPEIEPLILWQSEKSGDGDNNSIPIEVDHILVKFLRPHQRIDVFNRVLDVYQCSYFTSHVLKIGQGKKKALRLTKMDLLATGSLS
ncbi:hypothetical protein L6452_32384 [Arctium lappa]|uniref:Uncharacterized protein n=1 Tax=Arctium lappa TaxID=4217 RepID=A0ACB8Z464_ARCLA|nr:hypothetical protein L6452_32384 [Arctium lappa]